MLTDPERIAHMIEVIDQLMQIVSGITVNEYVVKTDEIVFQTAVTDIAPLREQLLL